MDSLPLSVDSMVAACRKYAGIWLDLFRYDFRRSRWTFHPPGGDSHPVNYTLMPEIAAHFGWPESRGVSA